MELPKSILAGACADAVMAIDSLYRLSGIRRAYPGQLANETLLRAFCDCRDFVDSALRGIDSDGRLSAVVKCDLHFENIDLPPDLMVLRSTFVMFCVNNHAEGSLSEAQIELEVREAFERMPSIASERATQLYSAILDLAIFGCRIPTEPVTSAGNGRATWLFRRYWVVITKILSLYGRMRCFESPDPLQRYYDAAGLRMRQLIDELRAPELLDPLAELLDQELGEDLLNAWQEWVPARLSAVERKVALVEASSRAGVHEPTHAEALFFDAADWLLEQQELKLTAEQERFVGGAGAQAGAAVRHSDSESSDPEVLLSRLELALREAVHTAMVRVYKDSWKEHLRKHIGQLAWDAALARWQRDARADKTHDVMHFLNFGELVLVAQQEWNILAKDAKNLQSKRFVELCEVVRKGRTPSAHSRPLKLWPTHERLRFAAACADLLHAFSRE